MNRMTELLERINYDLPGLKKAKMCYAQGDADGAMDAVIEHFRTRITPKYLFTAKEMEQCNSIIYLSALSSIDQELYDAAKVDGANRWQQCLHVTLPGIAPTIVIMLILKMGKIFNVGYERVMLLYNPAIYNTADVINTYVYRKGLIDAQFSYSTAVGMFNCLVSFALVMITNKISQKVNGSGLW